MNMALKQRGGKVISTLWKDAAANSGSVLSNELSQMGALGVPQQVLFRKWGATPAEAEHWEQLEQRTPTGGG